LEKFKNEIFFLHLEYFCTLISIFSRFGESIIRKLIFDNIQGGKGETPVLRSTGGVQAEHKRSTVEYEWSTAEYSRVQRSTAEYEWSTSGIREVRWSTGVPESRLFPLDNIAFREKNYFVHYL
jgi:hypothetical protein